MALLVISYSHYDRSLAKAIVSLLRGAFPHLKEVVYWDSDFEPGREWFPQMQRYYFPEESKRLRVIEAFRPLLPADEIE